MPRATKGAARIRARKRLMRQAKGYVGGRRRLVRSAGETIRRARAFAYRDRRTKKRQIRRLWIVRINAAARARGMKYSDFMRGLIKAGIMTNRKMLADLAVTSPDAFDQIVALAKTSLE